MGCKQSRQKNVKLNKDVEVRRKFQIGLHLTKEEAGLQVAFRKTSQKKYELPELVQTPAVPREAEEDNSVPSGACGPSILEVMRTA